MIPDKKYVVGVSSSNSSDLVMEDKKLVFKQPKKEEVPNKETGKEPSKDSGKDTSKDSGKDAPKDNSKDNKAPANSGKK